MTLQRVLVTGAGGTIGRPLVRHLRENGYDVLPVVARGASNGPLGAVEIDLSRPGLVLAGAVPGRPDAVVHLAALVPRRSRLDDMTNADATRRMDATVAAACARWGVPCVYASGCGLYDASDPREKDENARLVPRTAYLAAKLDGERMFAGVPSACVARISSPYHEGMHDGPVLARFLDTARRDGVLQIWGSGQREQDFIYCSDIADFVARVIRTGASGVFNVASGCPVTMAELARAAVRAVGRGQVQITVGEDPNEGATARISIQKARDLLGWSPRIGLDQGLALCSGKMHSKASDGH